MWTLPTRVVERAEISGATTEPKNQQWATEYLRDSNSVLVPETLVLTFPFGTSDNQDP